MNYGLPDPLFGPEYYKPVKQEHTWQINNNVETGGRSRRKPWSRRKRAIVGTSASTGLLGLLGWNEWRKQRKRGAQQFHKNQGDIPSDYQGYVGSKQKFIPDKLGWKSVVQDFGQQKTKELISGKDTVINKFKAKTAEEAVKILDKKPGCEVLLPNCEVCKAPKGINPNYDQYIVAPINKTQQQKLRRKEDYDRYVQQQNGSVTMSEEQFLSYMQAQNMIGLQMKGQDYQVVTLRIPWIYYFLFKQVQGRSVYDSNIYHSAMYYLPMAELYNSTTFNANVVPLYSEFRVLKYDFQITNNLILLNQGQTFYYQNPQIYPQCVTACQIATGWRRQEDFKNDPSNDYINDKAWTFEQYSQLDYFQYQNYNNEFNGKFFMLNSMTDGLDSFVSTAEELELNNNNVFWNPLFYFAIDFPASANINADQVAVNIILTCTIECRGTKLY